MPLPRYASLMASNPASPVSQTISNSTLASLRVATIARHGTDSLMFTVPVVTYGVFRYLFLVYRKSEGGDPAKLLFRDVPLVLSGILYVAVVLAILGNAHGSN